MTKRVAVLLLLITAALSFEARSQAQCTASPEDAAAAQAAIESVAEAHWPLPVPRGIQVTSYDDLRGALLISGSQVYQIESITWRIADNGSLDVASFAGYQPDGLAVRAARSGGKAIDSVASLGGFILGNPEGRERKIQVDSLRFATDAGGFLTVAEMKGVDSETGEAIVLAAPQDPAPDGQCGLRVSTGCNHGNCVNGACGAWPGCPCNGTGGSCSGFSNTVCSGTCPDNMVCNGSVKDCKCIPKPAQPAPDGGDATGDPS